MNQFAFRTECEVDNKRVPALLAALGVTEFDESSTVDGLVPDYRMGVFRFQAEGSLDEIHDRMSYLVANDPRFIDMHRCHQTLAEGSEPDEEWWRITPK